VELRRSLNGAIAGSVAAAAWAAQQPADKRAFNSPADDVELLGKLVARGDAWPVAGVALHLQNGAVLGALYAQLRRFLPGPPVVVALGVALGEHVATWTMVGVIDRLHPRRSELVQLKGNRRAFWQATWRHAVFGLVLGELERRLNADLPEEPAPVPASSNGHGSMETAVGVA
jgi:xanthosine utilization system XapX-like protein